MDVIRTEGLGKDFNVRVGGGWRALLRPQRRVVRAVTDIGFRLRAGERVAFVGPNGAGKSTTIKMLTGILQPTTGTAEVLNLTPWRHRHRLAYEIGSVFGQRSQLWYHLPALDSFHLLSKIYDLQPGEYRRRRDELVDIFRISELLIKPVRQLSLGERMRCEIVASLLHRPKILFLDEPTIGLDVTAKSVIRDFIRDRSINDGCTLLLTSHDTGDIERVCERVIIIDDGRLMLDIPIADLRSGFIRRKYLTVKTSEKTVAIRDRGVSVVEEKPHETRFAIDRDEADIQGVIAGLLRSATVLDLTIEDPPMEEIVRYIYRSHGLSSKGRHDGVRKLRS